MMRYFISLNLCGGETIDPQIEDLDFEDELIDEARKSFLLQTYIQQGTFESAAKSLGISRRTFARRWYDSGLPDPRINRDQHKTIDSDRYQLAVCSDLHLGSLWQQPTALLSFMEECKRRDIRDLLIPGDMTEGLMPRDGHPQQRFLDGIDEIHEYTNSVFDGFVDQFDSIAVINGNHDESLNGRSYGFDVAYNLSRDYKNIHYNKEPDNLVARYEIPGGLHAILYHGAGGCAQNLTTRTRNISGKLFNYSADWDLLVAGHCHSRSSDYWLGKYSFSVGAFQSMTPYLADRMLVPMVEGLILTYQVYDGVMSNVVPEVISYDHCLKRNDYPARFK